MIVTEKEKFYDVWLEKFIRDIGIKNSIILSGNTTDIIYNKYKGKYESLLNTLIDLLKEQNYSNIIIWDRTEGVDYKLSSNSAAESLKSIDFDADDKNAVPSNLYDMGEDDDLNQSGEPEYHDVDEFFSRMLKILKSDVGNVFILNYSDYLFGNSNALSEQERNNLLKLNKSLQSQDYNLTNFFGSSADKKTNNLIIIFTKNQATIPPEYYLKNPLVSTIVVPYPGRNERELFINTNITCLKTDPDISLPANSLIKETFIDSLDGFTLKEIAQIIKLSRQLADEILSPEKLINLFKYGEKISPWEELSKEKLGTIEESLKKRVKGQEEAIRKAKSVIIRAYTGFAGLQHSSKQRKPKGTLFFVGPTGVGKTELAKSIAEFVFGDENACIRFDMSEFSQEHSDQRLIGAPPGYVGYEAGGQLTNAVKEKPFCVLLFDEIEKAHPRILDKFLQILEDGRLTDSKGETVYFSETIIIFTSNIGATYITSDLNDIEAREKFINAVRDKFSEIERPELLNRIGDNIVVFNFIKDPSVFVNIAKAKFKPVIKFMKDRYKTELRFEDEDKVFEAIALEAGVRNGGRGMLNIIESKIINRLSEYTFLMEEDLVGRTVIIKQDVPGTTRFSFEIE